VGSLRDGFGRGGEWFWSLPTQPNTSVADTVAKLVSGQRAEVVAAFVQAALADGPYLLQNLR